MVGDLAEDGFEVFDKDPAILDWVSSARPAAERAVNDPQNAGWIRCGGTWFVGVDCLENAGDGSVGGGPPLAGRVVDRLRGLGWPVEGLHKAQLSVISEGYPRQGAEENAAAFRFRQNRDAAHLDGLLPEGPERRRMLKEPHAYILGLPLNEVSPEASPLVVWRGSHEIMRRVFAEAFQSLAVEDWAGVDMTEAYQAARREVFETCERVPLPAGPGQATLVHRLAIHGVAPWPVGLTDQPRMIAYFRPETDFERWLTAP